MAPDGKAISKEPKELVPVSAITTSLGWRNSDQSGQNAAWLLSVGGSVSLHRADKTPREINQRDHFIFVAFRYNFDLAGAFWGL